MGRDGIGPLVGYELRPGALQDGRQWRLERGCGLEGLQGLPDRSVDLVLTDVPYGEVNEVESTETLRKLNKGGADTLTFDLMAFADQAARVAASAVYVFCGFEQISPLVTRFRGRHGLTVRVLPWEKTNPSPMNEESIYPSAYEYCVYARLPGAYHDRSVAGRGPWRYPSGSSKTHPTQKPLPLFQRIVQTSCPPGGIVCDPCTGSGTAGEAAVGLGYRFVGWELDAEDAGWYQGAVERIDRASRQLSLF